MNIQLVRSEPRPMLFVRRRCALDISEIGRQTSTALQQLGAFGAENHIVPAGPPLTVYSDWTTKETTLDVGLPVAEADLGKAQGQVLAGRTPAGLSLMTVHRGPYDKLHLTYADLEKEMARLGVAMPIRSWEIYPVDPTSAAPEDLLTEVHMQISLPDAEKLLPGAAQEPDGPD